MATRKTSTTKAEGIELSVIEVSHGVLHFRVVGTSPLIQHAMSDKALHDLLYPQNKKRAADKQASDKHAPYMEFLGSCYAFRQEDDEPTRLYLPATAFKAALINAALDLPGVAKTQLGRLVRVLGDKVPVYGIPQMMMSVVRSADQNKTPDVRTRAILREWACAFAVRFVKPLVKEANVANLLAAAGYLQGVGDWRTQKGSGNYGEFRLAGADDADYDRIVAGGGRAAQDAALLDPSTYDLETDRLWAWFQTEKHRRDGIKAA